jgi:hypothetical protein
VVATVVVAVVGTVVLTGVGAAVGMVVGTVVRTGFILNEELWAFAVTAADWDESSEACVDVVAVCPT